MLASASVSPIMEYFVLQDRQRLMPFWHILCLVEELHDGAIRVNKVKKDGRVYTPPCGGPRSVLHASNLQVVTAKPTFIFLGNSLVA